MSDVLFVAGIVVLLVVAVLLVMGCDAIIGPDPVSTTRDEPDESGAG